MPDKDIKGKKVSVNGSDDAMADIVTAAGFLLFALLMLIGATRFTYQKEMGFVTSAGFTPILLAILVSILSIFLIVRTIRREKPGSIHFSAWAARLCRDETVRRSALLITITGLYIFLVGTVHFLPLTLLFLCTIYFYLKIGTIGRILIYSLANALLIGYVIPWIYQMPLP